MERNYKDREIEGTQKGKRSRVHVNEGFELKMIIWRREKKRPFFFLKKDGENIL